MYMYTHAYVQNYMYNVHLCTCALYIHYIVHVHVHCTQCAYTCCSYTLYLYIMYTCKCPLYMKIHVPSMLAIGVDKNTQQTNKQPQWLH